MKGLIFFYCAIAILGGCSSEAVKKPHFMGRPPQNAYTGLLNLDKGEIRHYGNNLFISSNDQGNSWDTVNVSDGNLYGRQSPLTGEFIRLFSGNNNAVFSVRSKGGVDGRWIKQKIDSNGAIMLKPAIFIKGGKRTIVGFHTKYRNGSGAYYSDDDGFTWKKSNEVNAPPHKANGFHKGPRWNHGAVEPTIIKLNDGRLWMLMRTAQDYHYESFSRDGGESWSKALPSRFYGTITMPTIQRLNDDRILFLWNNSAPLPELEHKTDYWEDVFTNRDVIHAAISEDDGKTWKGFREIYLNPLRNDSLMATRFGKKGSNDRSVHQSEFVELNNNNVLISLGQHPDFRALLKLDLRWLYEKERFDDFSNGLTNWSTHQYINGIKGHCAFNRRPGAYIFKHPDKSSGQVMLLKASRDSSLLYSNAGAVFNFPAGYSGQISFRVKFNPGFHGLQIGLHDRWFNPVDTVARFYAMHNLEISNHLVWNENVKLKTDSWYDILITWKNADILEKGICEITIDKLMQSVSLINKTVNGISYIHFLLPLKENTNEGVLIESILAKVN